MSATSRGGHAPIYLLRHGETEWNVELRMQGGLDSPLTARGREQAVAMGRGLAAALRRDRVAPAACDWIASPRGRARETALLVGEMLETDGGPPASWREDARIAELRYGAWEGRTWHEVERELPGARSAWAADPLGFTPPDGETHAELAARVRRFLDDLLAAPRPTVVVGHGVSGAVLRGLYLRLTPQQMFGLEKPQDAFFRLHGGVAERIAAIAD